MTQKKSLTPPAHLKKPTADWWLRVRVDYTLEEHHVRLLTLAGEAWDRGVEAREVLAKKGLTYDDRFDQPRARPEVTIERDSRISFARLVRELGLDLEDPAVKKPPIIPGNAGLKVRAQ